MLFISQVLQCVVHFDALTSLLHLVLGVLILHIGKLIKLPAVVQLEVCVFVTWKGGETLLFESE